MFKVAPLPSCPRVAAVGGRCQWPLQHRCGACPQSHVAAAGGAGPASARGAACRYASSRRSGSELPHSTACVPVHVCGRGSGAALSRGGRLERRCSVRPVSTPGVCAMLRWERGAPAGAALSHSVLRCGSSQDRQPSIANGVPACMCIRSACRSDREPMQMMWPLAGLCCRRRVAVRTCGSVAPPQQGCSA